MTGKKLIALDIGNKTTKIVYGFANKKEITVYEYEIINTPADSIKDGMITNAEKLAAALLETFKKIHIKGGSLVFNITGTGVITREIQLPMSTSQEIAQILGFEAQQYFPVDLSNYTTDFKVLENIQREEGKFCRVLIVAAPNKQLDSYIKLSTLLKYSLHSIDIPANCVLKLQSYQWAESIKNDEDYAVIDIGRDTSMVCIFRNSNLKFSRILLNGSYEIDRQIANRLNIDYKKAEEMKISYSNPQQTAIFESEDQTVSLTLAIEDAMGNIVSDIGRFIEFYNSRENKNRVQRIYLCGGGSKLHNMNEYFSNSFNMPVLLFPFRREIQYMGNKDKSIFELDYNKLINAIGSLLN